jgi:hypothetical protein
MTEKQDVLFLVLAPERSPEERLASLLDLRDYLSDEEVVLALAAAARTETSTEVRSAMLGVLVDVDLTRLTRREELLDALMAFSALEPEPELRLAATRRLAGLAASSPAIPDLLAENLLYDLSPDIQRACIAGIAACPTRGRSVVERVIAAANAVQRSVRHDLLGLYEQLERADMEAGLLALLDPLEAEALRRAILDGLGRLPSLSPAIGPPLLAYLAAESDPDLRALAVRVLSDGVRTTPELLGSVLDAVRRTPEDAPLLYAFWGHLFSFPDAVSQLRQLFEKSGSTRVKLYLLRLLADSQAIPLFTAALGDPSPWVRAQAAELCSRHGRGHPEVGRALAERIPEEGITSLRVRMIEVVDTLGTLDHTAEETLLHWIPRETFPGARTALAGALTRVAITDANRTDLLGAYLAVLTDPLAGDEVTKRVGERLAAFEYRNEPELAECLMALMDRSTDLREVERLHTRLRTLQPDPATLLPVIRRLFYRFAGVYPQAPLDAWLRELVDAAAANPELQAEVPYLVRLTGASWLLEKAAPAAQKAVILPAILEAIRKGQPGEAERLLAEAYEHRTLRKSDAVALFREVLSYHDAYPLLGSILRILREVGVVTEEIVDRCLGWLGRFPAAPAARDVVEYLRAMGPLEPSWAERLDAAFCAERYNQFAVAYLSADRRYPPTPVWSEPWRPPSELREWPLAELFFAQAPAEAIAARLEGPVVAGGLPHHSFHLLVLARLNQRLNDGGTLAAPELGAIGRLLAATAPPTGLELLHDRALWVFDRAWPRYLEGRAGKEPEPELTVLAAEVAAEVAGRR